MTRMRLTDALKEIDRLNEELRDLRHRREGEPFAPAVALGRLGGLKGGKSKSDAKVAAARKNGQKGGWPKGKKRTKRNG